MKRIKTSITKSGWMTLLNLDDELPFGKYKGKELWEVFEEDFPYIIWMVNNLDSWGLDDEAYKLYREKN